MGTFLIGVLLVLLGTWLVARIFKTAARYQLEDQPPEEVPPGDSNVREPRPGRPLAQSGAVAVPEPEEELDTDAYSRR